MERISQVFIETQLHDIVEIFKQRQVEFAYLVGSFARGNSIWNSDMDIFVSLSNIISNTDFDQLQWRVDISTEIDQILGLQIVEVQILEFLPLHVQFSGINEGFLLYQRNEKKRRDFIEILLSKYYDHKIWLENLLKESLAFQDSLLNVNK